MMSHFRTFFRYIGEDGSKDNLAQTSHRIF